jgi:hypothetical protein
MKKTVLALCLGMLAQSQLALAGSYYSSYAAPYETRSINRESLAVLSQSRNQLVEIVGEKDYGRQSYSYIQLHVQNWGNNTTSHLGFYISLAKSDVQAIVKAVCKGQGGTYGRSLMGDASFARIGSDLDGEVIRERRGEFLSSISCD